jgi:Domain of unknown function (DUF4386)
MGSTKRTARIAGLLYLVAILTGVFSLRYVPSKIIVWNNSELTFKNIIEHETLFRLGILAGIVGYTVFFILPIVLYRLLNHVNKSFAIAMVSLAVVSVPFSLVNLLYKVNILTLIRKEEYHVALDTGQLQAQVLLNLHFYNNGIEIASIFLGLWLLPFGYLVFRSGFLPKILGILLMAGCFGYLINFIGVFLFQNYNELGISRFVTLPASLGEIGICLWLLIVGVKVRPNPATPM